MKIQEPVKMNFGEPRMAVSERASSNTASFQKIMKTYSMGLTQDRFQQMLEDIDKQGQQLAEKRTFQELRKYKDLVKRFMNEVTQNGTGLFQTETWDPYGGNKTLKTVQVLDKKLMDLTDHVLNQEKTGLSILERVGEIKGLLINLYT